MLAFVHITAEANAGAKALPGTACKLGVGGKPQADTGKYEAEQATLTLATIDFIQINP